MILDEDMTQNLWKELNELNETRSKSSRNKNEGLNGVVGKPTTKRISLIWSYGIHLKL